MTSPLAERIAIAVMRDLRGRKGILDDVEQDICEEIELELADKVQRELNKAGR